MVEVLTDRFFVVDTRLIAVLVWKVSLRVRFVFSWFSLSEISERVWLVFEEEEEVEFKRSAPDNTDETEMDAPSSVLPLTNERADLATTASPFVSDTYFAATNTGIAIILRITRRMIAGALQSKFIDT